MSDETIARLHDDGRPPRLDTPPRTPTWIGFAMAASIAALAVVLAFRGAEPDLTADPLAVEVDPAARAKPLTDSDGAVLAARER